MHNAILTASAVSEQKPSVTTSQKSLLEIMTPKMQKVIQLFGLNKTGLSDKQLKMLAEMLAKHKELWKRTREDPIEHTDLMEFEMELLDDIPFKHSYRTRDPTTMEIEKRHIEKMAKRKVIRPSKSLYALPILLVAKAGGKIRFCIDYRALNAKTKKWQYPLPRIDDIITVLGGSAYYSTMDLTDAFWSIPIRESDKEKTAFVSRYGL